MATERLLAVCALALALLAGPRAAGASTTADDYTWNGTMKRGQTVTILGINGSIRAELAKGNVLEVVAVRSSRKHDPTEVRIEMHQEGDEITFCAIYPAAKGYPPNTCGDASHSSSHTDSDDLTVDFRVRVPAGVTLRARTVNGEIVARALEGPIDATTVNGEVHLSTSSYAEASSVNGDVEVEMAGKGWPDGLDFRTVNGSILLHLSDVVNADFRAETMNGEIDSDFPLTLVGRLKKNRIQGKIGDGGPELAMATLNGSIELRRTTR